MKKLLIIAVLLLAGCSAAEEPKGKPVPDEVNPVRVNWFSDENKEVYKKIAKQEVEATGIAFVEMGDFAIEQLGCTDTLIWVECHDAAETVLIITPYDNDGDGLCDAYDPIGLEFVSINTRPYWDSEKISNGWNELGTECE